MTPTVYLVSGANRGIGLGLVTSLAARKNVVVFAGARNPASATDLKALQTKYSGTLRIVKLTSADRADNTAAFEEIKSVAGRLDVVIANAGIAKFWDTILNTPEEEMREHYEVNVIGPLVLFQTVWPLLKESPKPQFSIITSIAGSIAIGASMPAGFLAYGASKAAVNFFGMKLHSEHPELAVSLIHPGAVVTDAGLNAAAKDKIAAAMSFISVEESVAGVLQLVDAAKPGEEGPKMIGYDGAVLPW